MILESRRDPLLPWLPLREVGSKPLTGDIVRLKEDEGKGSLETRAGPSTCTTWRVTSVDVNIGV